MKLSIITPVYNGEKYIARTIESVISQKGDFDIEYLVQDGGSTDGTLAIVKQYAELVRSGKWNRSCKSVSFSWHSEKDGGMYDAINRGLKKASGDIYAYINADDIYLPNAFEKITAVFKTFPEINWVTGTCPLIDEDDKIFRAGNPYLYDQKWIARGIYGRSSYHIPQNSVFWRSSLWRKAGPCHANYKYAGDYDLWIKFAKREKLWSLNVPISCFRKRAGQLSADIRAYKKEQKEIVPKMGFKDFFVRVFFSLQSRSHPHFQKIFLWLYRLVFLEKGAEYVDFENGKPVKKPAYSFIAAKPEESRFASMGTKAIINSIIGKTGYQISKADRQISRRSFIQQSIIDFKPTGKILELGAGIDRTARDRFPQVTTFDQIEQPGIDVVGDIHDLSQYFGKEFDTVLCMDVFEHTKDLYKAMSEIQKVLKPGGAFIGSAPVTTELHGEDYGHYWNITPQGWELLLKDFDIEQMKLRGTRPNISHVAVKAILK